MAAPINAESENRPKVNIIKASSPISRSLMLMGLSLAERTS